jgi:UPF0755 protein
MLNLYLLFLGCFLFSPDLSETVDASDDVVREFEVPKGASGYSVGKKLEGEGLILSASDWKWFLKHEADGSCIKAGRFELTRAMTIPQVAKVLCDKPLGNDTPFTVLEGWRIREIDEALAMAGYIQAGEYAALAAQPALFNLPFEDENLSSLEGFLLPETYRLNPLKFKAKKFIQRQLRTFWERFAREHGAGMAHRGFYEVVIMASLLEREEPDPKLRPLVAGILWKRLENNWHLGVDATSRYSIEKWNDRKAFLKQLRDPNDPYNTRLKPGFPPTPIGNPSLESLEAAMRPESSPYWYYLHDSKGNMHPSRSAKEHEAYRKRYNVY